MKYITIKLSMKDAQKLIEFIEGAYGSSECEKFNKFARRILKKLGWKAHNYDR